MILNDLSHKKIAILGLGIENQAMILYLLKKKLPIKITICDFRSKKILGDAYKKFAANKNISWNLGAKFNQDLEKFDIMFRSPGWPIKCPGVQRALKNKVVLYSPMKLFFDLCPTKKIIGVTGTKGKGTTSSLIYSIISKAGKKVFLGGNIGVAPFDFLSKIQANDWVVLELSSFQLEDMHKSPHISVIVNFYPEHLSSADPNNPNFHASYAAYKKAKLNIVKFQTQEDCAIIQKKIELPKIGLGKGKLIRYDKANLKSELVGEHNQENIAAALTVADIIGIEKNAAEKSAASFTGLPMRIELIKVIRGVSFYNDSFATTPDASITAIKSFSSSIILIAGGADKGSNFKKFALKIKKRVKLLILLSDPTTKGTKKIMKELMKIKFPRPNIVEVSDMKEAVELAKKTAASGDIVLLSTGCASFGMFKNYKERGKQFDEQVNTQATRRS